MNDPTCVSLFSGIGGLDEGIRRAGFRHLAFCESDAYRRAVLRARFGGVPVYDDVRAFPGSREERRGADALSGRGRSDETSPTEFRSVSRRESDAQIGTPTVSLLCGGFPCQDVSVAGRRRGLAGDRSGLFFEFARIAESLRLRWLLVENVPGLLSSNGGRDFGVVLGTLADIGYGLGWRILDSRFFGVPQRRRRLFVVGAVADGDTRAAAERAGQVLAVGSRCRRHPATRAEARENVAVASLSGLGSGGPDDNDGQGGRLVAAASVRRLTPVECERLQALPDGWTDLGGTADSKRYAALGDAVTANVAEWIGTRIIRAAEREDMPAREGAGS